jgi:hypothetical protein
MHCDTRLVLIAKKKAYLKTENKVLDEEQARRAVTMKTGMEREEKKGMECGRNES